MLKRQPARADVPTRMALVLAANANVDDDRVNCACGDPEARILIP
jgi:hypothetical protein